MTQPKVSHGLSSPPLQVGEFRLTTAHYAAGQRVGPHEHAFPSWTLLLSGAFHEIFSRDVFTCTPGTVVAKPATADHSNTYGPQGASCLLIEYLDSDGGDSNAKAQFVAPRLFADGSVPRIAQKIHAEFVRRDSLRNLSLECLLIELDLASARGSTSSGGNCKGWLKSVRDRLECEFRQPPSLTTLAAEQGVHPAYLCQQFREAFGMSAGEYVRSVRYAWARRCIMKTDLALSEVALSAGYSDQAHFSRDFKRRTGISPHRFRSDL